MRFVLICTLLCLHLSSYAQPNLQDKGLRGPVQFVEEKQVALSNKLRSWFSGPLYMAEMIQSKPPYPVVSKEAVEGNLYGKNRFEFSPQGVLLLEDRRYGDDSLNYRIDYVYNEEDHCVEIVHEQRRPELNWREVISYEGTSTPAVRIEYDVNRDMKARRDLRYEQERIQQEIFFDSQNKFLKKIVYVYSETNQLLSITQFDLNDNMQVRREYQYDDRGNRISESVFDDKESLTGGWIYEYDDRDRPIQQTMLSSRGGVENRRLYRYDERDSVIEMESFGKRDPLLYEAYQYEYDAQGNWIKKITYYVHRVWGQPVYSLMQAEYRTITYYPGIDENTAESGS